MRKFILACILLLSFSIASYAQPSGKDGNLSKWSQMWNPSSVYYGTVTTQDQIGYQKDTVTTSTTVNLATSSFQIQLLNKHTNIDTVIASPLSCGSNGSITFFIFAYMVTSTPNMRAQLQTSIDCISWTNIVGDTVHLSPTSLTVPASASFTVNSNLGRFFQWSCTSATQSTAIKASYIQFNPWYAPQP